MKIILVLLLVTYLLGCASGKLDYTPPKAEEVETFEAEIKGTYDQVWRKIVDKLSQNAYVINNLSKESGLINFSFEIAPPDDYADCGKYIGEFSNLRGSAKYDFNGASSANFTIKRDALVFNVERKTSLSGRGNVFVKKNKKESILVRFNAIFTLKGTDYKTFMGPNYSTQRAVDNFSVTFSTKEKGKNSQGFMVCQSKGIIEAALMSSLR